MVPFLSTDTANGTRSKKKKKKKLESCHAGNSHHQQAVLEAYGTIERFENPTNTVKSMTDENLKQRYQVYPNVVEALARVVHLPGKQ